MTLEKNLSEIIMEKNMTNFKLCLGTLFISVFLIFGTSFYGVYKEHEKRLRLVSEKRITEACETCFLEGKCSQEKTTLEDLMTLNYLKEEVNPLTKLYYSHASYVLKENNTYVFYEVND